MTPRHRTARPLLAAALIVAGYASLASAQAAMPDAWRCLPDNTVLIVRMPEPYAMIKQLRQTTKFGRVLLSEQRWQRLIDDLRNESPDEWEEMERGLGEVGLQPADLPNAARETFGYGLVMDKRAGRDDPMLVGIAWANPGDELGAKLVRAIEKALEIQAREQEHPAKRVDITLAETRVMHIAQPVYDYVWGATEPAPFGGMSTRQDFDEPEREHVDQVNFFVARVGGRLVMAHTFEQNAAAVRMARAEGRDVDFDRISGVEQAKGVLARFLEAHRAGGAPEPAILATPGLADALPGGRPMVEVYGDARPLFRLLDQSLKEQPDGDRALGVIEALGLKTLSTGAVRLSIDGTNLRSGMFLAAPAPRRGLIALLDQKPLPAAPPDWVPAHVVDYSQISFDLGQAYGKVRSVLIEQLGDEARKVFDQVDLTVNSLVQADLTTVLSGLGRRHTVLTYMPRVVGGDLEAMSPGDLTRMALVWQVTEEDIWQRMVMAAASVGMFLGPAFGPADEQGFTGWRVQNEQMEAALLLGKGYLTLTFGNGVTAEVLSVLRKAPTGEAALVNSPDYRRAAAMIESRPATIRQFSNTDRYAETMVRMIGQAMEEAAEMGSEGPEFEILRRFLPKADELEGVLGVSIGQAYVTDDGFASESLMELPAE